MRMTRLNLHDVLFAATAPVLARFNLNPDAPAGGGGGSTGGALDGIDVSKLDDDAGDDGARKGDEQGEEGQREADDGATGERGEGDSGDQGGEGEGENVVEGGDGEGGSGGGDSGSDSTKSEGNGQGEASHSAHTESGTEDLTAAQAALSEAQRGLEQLAAQRKANSERLAEIKKGLADKTIDPLDVQAELSTLTIERMELSDRDAELRQQAQQAHRTYESAQAARADAFWSAEGKKFPALGDAEAASKALRDLWDSTVAEINRAHPRSSYDYRLGKVEALFERRRELAVAEANKKRGQQTPAGGSGRPTPKKTGAPSASGSVLPSNAGASRRPPQSPRDPDEELLSRLGSVKNLLD